MHWWIWGEQGTPPLPLGQDFFMFMQFSGKNYQIVSWRLSGSSRPFWEILDPATVMYLMHSK